MSTFDKNQVQDIYYLSPMQEGMLFHALLHPDENYYYEQITTHLEGDLDLSILESSMQTLMDRYEIFRTVFVHEKMKRPLQVVLKKRPFYIEYIDLTTMDKTAQAESIHAIKEEDKDKGFDLTKDVLIRSKVIKLGKEDFLWIWSYHHILLDGWCFGTVVQELFQIYQAFFNNKNLILPTVKPYKDYIRWIEGQDKQKSLNYWARLLKDFEGQSTFAELAHQAVDERYIPDEMVFKLSIEQTETFTKLAKGYGVTLNTALQTVWGLLLSHYQRTEDIIFGTVVSGRPLEVDGVEKMVGLFINTIPKRIRFSYEDSFKECMLNNHKESIESETHHYIPLYDIQSEVKATNLIDHLVVFENYPVATQTETQQKDQVGFVVKDTEVFEQSNYAFNLVVSPGEQITFKFGFNANRFKHDFISRLKGQLLTVIEDVCANPDKKLYEINILHEDERNKLLSIEKKDDLLVEETLTSRFEKIVNMYSNKIALRYFNLEMTYFDLNVKANQLAKELSKYNIGKGSIVGILLNRSPEMIISILGILKVGATYLPIDPDYPTERIHYMLNDSGASTLIVRSDQRPNIPKHVHALMIDKDEIWDNDIKNPKHLSHSNDLAYVIYTSGTTGEPKGTLTSHQNIMHVVTDTNYIDIQSNDRFLSVSNFAFDGFTFDLFGALLNGACLVVAAKETILNITKLTQLIETEAITIFFATTALFNLLTDSGERWMHFPRKVLFGGERASVKHVRKAFRIMGPGKLINVYGPTETTVFTTFYPIEDEPAIITDIPIGKPIRRTSLYILNKYKNLLPYGSAGELYISGTGVAKGYLNRKELSQLKFITNPYVPGEKLYRSGDVVKWLPNGHLAFLGRIDDQVKIRGHRIELGEIREYLLSYPGLKDVEVIIHSDLEEDQSLYAYFVSEDGQHLEEKSLKKFLAQSLPHYMVPAAFIELPQLPLTSNGKVNRKELTSLKTNKRDDNKMMPRDEMEEQLSKLWTEVLGITGIGVHENFFDLGGHSLKGMALNALILKTMKIDLPLSILFQSPTIAELAERLQDTSKEKLGPYTVFNPDAKNKLFLFPPIVGYGAVFRELSFHLPDYRLYAFDFIEDINRIEQYKELISSIAPEGSINLMGYSAGCALLFEVAQALEEEGMKINALIMVDSYKKTDVSDLKGRSVDQDIKSLVQVNQSHSALQSDIIREGLSNKLKAYYAYFVKLINEGMVNADIYMLRSEFNTEIPVEMLPWKFATKGDYHEYTGSGAHEELLFEPNVHFNGTQIHRMLKEANQLDKIT